MSYNSKYTGAELESRIDEIPNKQDRNVYLTNVEAAGWVSDVAYSDFPYRCDVACEGVTAAMYARVVFGATDAVSGDYAPVCETLANVVRIWSKKNVTITIPTIVIYK